MKSSKIVIRLPFKIEGAKAYEFFKQLKPHNIPVPVFEKRYAEDLENLGRAVSGEMGNVLLFEFGELHENKFCRFGQFIREGKELKFANEFAHVSTHLWPDNILKILQMYVDSNDKHDFIGKIKQSRYPIVTRHI